MDISISTYTYVYVYIYTIYIYMWAKVGLQMFLWKIIGQLINNKLE